MSVPVNERSTSKLEVCIKAHDLCCYTLQITKNKKVFSEEYQSALTDKIIQLALDIHTECWGANNIIVTQESDFEMRTMMQTNALAKCNELLSLIEVAKSIFHLSTKRVIYWSQKVITTRKLISAWRTSDRKRYKDMGCRL